MDFEQAYAEHATDIEKRSWHEHITGYDRDDVQAEMLTCLWRACQTYDPDKGSFASYWWSIWLNRRNDLSLFWKRRPTLVMVGDTTYLDSWNYDQTFVIPPAPSGFGRAERMVWQMIALGLTREQILGRMSLSKRGYYNILRSWKRHEVRSALI